MFWFFFPEETRHLQLFIFYYYYFAILRRFTTPKKKNLYLVLWYCQIWLYFSFCFLDGVTFWLYHKIREKKREKNTLCGLVLSSHGKDEKKKKTTTTTTTTLWWAFETWRRKWRSWEGWVFAFHELNKKKFCWWSFVKKKLGFLFETSFRC